MARNSLDISFGVTGDPKGRFRNVRLTGKGNRGAFAKGIADAEFKAMTGQSVFQIARKLREELAKQFQPHDRSEMGKKRFHVHMAGMIAHITMEGGAVFVEYGTSDHWIEPVNASALHWSDEGGDYFSKGHNVSGITADPFVERAVDEVDVSYELRRLAMGITGSIKGYAESSLMGEATVLPESFSSYDFTEKSPL